MGGMWLKLSQSEPVLGFFPLYLEEQSASCGDQAGRLSALSGRAAGPAKWSQKPL